MVSIKHNKTILSLAVAIGLSFSSGAVADGREMDALYDRIEALEAQVQALLRNQQPVLVDTVVIEATANKIAETKATEVLVQHKAAVAEDEHKHNYTFGGYIKLDTIFSDYSGGSVPSGTAGRDFYIPGLVPVGNGSGEIYLDIHAKESRINFSSEHLLDSGATMRTYFELDFLVGPGGNERVSNSYSPRLRHAFFTYNKWTFGQTWTTFFNVEAQPDNLDFVGPAESIVFGRQPMIRYTSGPWQFAIENPETTITPYGGGGRIVTDDNLMPDVVLRYNLKSDWGSFVVAGTLRQLAYENQAAGIDDSIMGYGLSLSGKVKVGDKNDFRWMATVGSGMGRYFGLNLVNSSVLDANGKLEAIDSYGMFGSYRHFWNNQWRSNFTLGYSSVDNNTALTGFGVTSKASSAHINLIYSPVPKMDFGLELMIADREIESGLNGDLTRFQFSAKYGF
ncbi:MAG: DcaP family trimeric outer membrane transporter [Xanthomonadales bacterium]|nr:DcaP family trimeric outer membrane transporter [Xanthomonadales bacterium]